MSKTYRKDKMSSGEVKRNKKASKESRKFRKEKRKIIPDD